MICSIISTGWVRKMKKRIIILGLTLLSVLSLASCNSNDNPFGDIETEYSLEFKNAPKKGEAVDEVKFNGINSETGNIEEILISNNTSYEDVYNIFVKYNFVKLKPVSDKFKFDYTYEQADKEDLSYKRNFVKSGDRYLPGGQDYSIVNNYKYIDAWKGTITNYIDSNDTTNEFSELYYEPYSKYISILSVDTKSNGNINHNITNESSNEIYLKYENSQYIRASKSIRNNENNVEYLFDDSEQAKFKYRDLKNRSVFDVGCTNSIDMVSLYKPIDSSSLLKDSFEGNIELTDNYIIIKYKLNNAYHEFISLSSTEDYLKTFEGSSFTFEIWFDYKKLDIITNNQTNEYVNNGYTYLNYCDICKWNRKVTYEEEMLPNGCKDLAGKNANISNNWKWMEEVYMIDISDDEINTKKNDFINYCKNNKN